MHPQPLSFSVDFFPSYGGQYTVTFRGQATYAGPGDPQSMGGYVADAIRNTTQQVVQNALTANQVGLPTLSMSLPHFIGAIVAQSAQPLGWQQITVSALHLEADVPQEAVAPAANQVMSGSEIAANVAGNFVDNVVHSAAPVVPAVHANVGGMNLAIGPGAASVEDQVKSEIQDRIIMYAVVGGVLVLLTGICVVMLVVKLFF